MGKSQRRPQTRLSNVHLPHKLEEENKNIHTEKFSQKSVDKESPDQNQINSRANSLKISGGMPLNRKMIIKLNKWRQNKVGTAASITRGIRS